MPLLRAEWWEAHQPLVVFMWIILLVVPFAIVYGAGDTFETVLECIVNDYLTFIVLLFGLFCVSGNITVGGDFAGSPRVNACLLALGTLLSSCIGTTGANMGGCLTPIGDPPLLMGFMRGVLPGMSAFQDAAGNVRGIRLYGEVTLTLPALIEIVIILLAAFLSFKTTDSSIRTKNHFTWGAIKEVAVLFIGIFITMQPALMI